MCRFGLIQLILLAATLTGCSRFQLTKKTANPLPDAASFLTTHPADAAPSGSPYFHVEIFKIEAPLGTFSTNESFWKTIDEQCVDPAAAELLQRNGIRVGVAPISELSQFSKVMDNAIPADKLAVTTGEMKQTRITMKEHVMSQNIFYYNLQNLLVGNSTSECENAMQLMFQPTPRQPDHLTATMTPVVRALVRQPKYTALNNEYEINYYNPEMFYDLKLRANLPLGGFLIVAPSSNATDSTSVGNAFFLKTGGADQMEEVLLMVPSQLRIGRALPIVNQR